MNNPNAAVAVIVKLPSGVIRIVVSPFRSKGIYQQVAGRLRKEKTS